MIDRTWQLLRELRGTLRPSTQTSFGDHRCIRIRLFCLRVQTSWFAPNLQLHRSMRPLLQDDRAMPSVERHGRFLVDGMASALRTTNQATPRCDRAGNCDCFGMALRDVRLRPTDPSVDDHPQSSRQAPCPRHPKIECQSS